MANSTLPPVVADLIHDLYDSLPEGSDVVFASETDGVSTSVDVRDALAYVDQADPGKPLFLTPGAFCRNSVRGHGRGRLDKNVAALSALFFDFDAVRFETNIATAAPVGLPEPSYVFRRGDRAHVYYILSSPIVFTGPGDPERKRINRLFKAIAKRADADRAPAHVGTYLRCPGFVHVKNGVTSPGYEIDESCSTRKRYSLDAFAGFAPAVEPEEATGRAETVPVSADAKAILLAPRPTINQGEGRSLALFHFGARCRDFGLSEEDACTLAVDFNGLYLSPPEHSHIVRHQVESAYKYAQTPPGRYLEIEEPEKVRSTFEMDTHISTRLRGWVYVLGNETLRSIDESKTYTTQNQIQNALIYLTGCQARIGYILQHRLVTVADEVTFRPLEEARFIETGACRLYNSYFPGDAPVVHVAEKTRKGNVKAFLDHVRLLTTTQAEYEHLLDFLAITLTRPGVKINHAVLLVSEKEGLGKSLLQELHESCIKRGIRVASNNDLAKGHNSWMDSALVCFVHEVGQAEKFHVLDILKSWVADSRVTVSDKWMRSYSIENFCNFYFFSNASNALPVGTYDRRFFTVVNRKDPETPDYYREMYRVFTEGAGDIYDFLLSREVTLDPKAPPPQTDGKHEMRRLSRSELFLYLDDLLDSGRLAKLTEAPGFTVRRFIDEIEFDAPKRVQHTLSQKQVAIWLREKEFVPIEKSRVNSEGHRAHVRLYATDARRLENVTYEELVKL